LSGDIKKEIRQTLKVFIDADDALRKGDFAKYGELQKLLRAHLERLSK
jgi:hypothetical protein